MADILNIPMLGRLEIVETYAYYDQPVLFSCKNAAGHLYLVVAADENEQNETWLYAGISEGRLQQIRCGAIDLHEAFADPEDGCVLQAIVPYDDQTPLRTEPIEADQIPEDMLPMPGECLNLETHSLPVLVSPQDIANSRKQEILHLTLNFGGVLMTEAPTTALSQILGSLQGVINTIGMSRFDRNRLTEGFKRKMQTSVVEVGAGSFDIRLASNQMVDLLNHSDFGDAIEKFLDLLKAGSNQDELKKLLSELKLRVAKNYTKFLKSLHESVSNTKLAWTSPNPKRGGSAFLSELQIREAIDILERFQEEAPSTFKVTGKLIGASLKTNRFDIRTTEKTYTGDIAAEAIETVSTVTLSQQYTATIQEITEKSETTGEITKPKYLLLSLNE